MFKINHCKIFGHKLYTTMTLKKKHDGTKKGKQLLLLQQSVSVVKK